MFNKSSLYANRMSDGVRGRKHDNLRFFSNSINSIELRIVLIDGEVLADYMLEFNVSVSIQSNYEVKLY